MLRNNAGNYIPAVLLASFVNTKFKPANNYIRLQNFIGSDRYTLIEQSGTYANWQVALKFNALNCFEMHVVRESALFGITAT